MHVKEESFKLSGLNNLKSNKRRLFLIQLLLLFLFQGCNQGNAPDSILSGFWIPKKYLMSNGESKDVYGHISFGKNQWSVVFFILDEEGNPTSGSAEGGEFMLEDDNLTFWHYYNFADISKGTSGNLNKTIYKEDQRQKELCRIEIDEDILVIYFPSGNAMIFSKSA